MECTRECPDEHVANLGHQFLDTAILLRANLPGLVAPSALRVNAAFAIELFLKSFLSRWKRHPIEVEPDLNDEPIESSFDPGDGFSITSETNVWGHNLGCATNSNLPKTILGEFYSGRGAHRLTRLGEEAFSRLHFVQPSSSPSRVKRSLPLTTKSSSEKSPNFLETAICRAPQTQPVQIVLAVA